jgi:uncharacterized protein
VSNLSSDFADDRGHTILVPSQSPASEPFWAATKDGVLLIQCCQDTGRLIFPPRPRSPYGNRLPPRWTTVSGQGSIWSYVVPHPPLTPQFEAFSPYNVIVVALEEDQRVRLVGNLIAGPNEPINSVDPESIHIGEPVEVVFGTPLDDGVRLPRWRRRGARS